MESVKKAALSIKVQASNKRSIDISSHEYTHLAVRCFTKVTDTLYVCVKEVMRLLVTSDFVS